MFKGVLKTSVLHQNFFSLNVHHIIELLIGESVALHTVSTSSLEPPKTEKFQTHQIFEQIR